MTFAKLAAVTPEMQLLRFWTALGLFYPVQAAQATSWQIPGTIKGLTLFLFLFLVGPAWRRAATGARWLQLVAFAWVAWTFIGFLPVFTGWLLAHVLQWPLPPFLENIWHESSTLKQSVAVILAPAAAVPWILAIRDGNSFWKWSRAVVVLSALLTTISLLEYVGQFRTVATTYVPQVGRLFGFAIPDANGYGRSLLLPMLLCTGLLTKRHDGVKRSSTLIWIAAVLLALSIFLTLSRTTFVSVTVGLTTLLVLTGKNTRSTMIGVVFVLAIGGTALFSGVFDAFATGSERRDRNNFDTRLVLYDAGMEIVREFPTFGSHPGGYVDALVGVGFQGGYYVIDSERPLYDSMHNMLLALAVEWGVPVAALLVIALLAGALSALRALMRLRRRSNRGDSDLEVGACVSIAATMTLLAHGITEVVPPELAFDVVGLAVAIALSARTHHAKNTQNPGPSVRETGFSPRSLVRRG